MDEFELFIKEQFDDLNKDYDGVSMILNKVKEGYGKESQENTKRDCSRVVNRTQVEEQPKQ